MRPIIAAREQAGRLKRYLLGSGLGPFLIRASAGSGAVHLAGKLFSFLVGVQLARGLGVEGYGQYGIAMAVIALASIPGEFGLPRLVTREVAAASTKSDLPRLYGVISWADRTALLLSLSAMLMLAAGGFLFVREDGSTVAWAVLVGAPIIPLVALLKIRGGALQGLTFIVHGQLPAELLRPLIFSALLLALFSAFPGAGAAQAVGLNVITALAGLLVAFAWLRTRLPKPRPLSVAKQPRRWLASSFRIALADGLRMTNSQLAILLLGVLATVSSVGLFRIATSIAVVISLPITLMNTVVAPVIARLWAEGDKRRLQRLCAHAAWWTTLGVILLSLPFALSGGDLVSLVFGAEFGAANTALLILACGQVTTAAFGPNFVLLTMSGHEDRVTRAMFLGLLLGALTAMVLIPFWAEIGAAVATFASILFWNVAIWLDARRLIWIKTSVIQIRSSR